MAVIGSNVRSFISRPLSLSSALESKLQLISFVMENSFIEKIKNNFELKLIYKLETYSKWIEKLRDCLVHK